MGHDVFISHSSKDAAVAHAILRQLERDGVRCWIAPRDIVPGATWATSIVQAITGSRLMVLVVSANSNQSSHVCREVERSIGKGVPVVPVRIDDVVPTGDLEYFLSACHWMRMPAETSDEHLRQLSDAVRVLLARAADGPPAATTAPQVSPRLVSASRVWDERSVDPAARPLSQAATTRRTAGEAAEAGVNWEPGLLERARVELATYMGPMARVLVTRAAARANTPATLRDLLAADIPSPDERERFRRNAAWANR
jgi:hypothetical protein